ncbi:hypothetical protein EJ02DRAFT_460634 [Clathrospora elynae]|uniref:Uncharacterized protein n=1 Tax=Clathrospora elynae TaxID=706981 RepID=A0A6A5S3A3_9PLEO|nr:hypothetical protein EJ02DRAFT_460634 [Clathrospora elynae]
MIYQHLSTRENEVISREHSRATLDPLTRLYGYDFGRWKAQHFPEHFWSTSYVGATFSQELVENYYRSSTFIFGDDPGVLRKWLATDEFKMGLLPKELVGSVEIRLNAVSHDRGSFRAYIFGVPKSPGRMQEALDGLFELKAGARVCVRFLTEAKTTEERDEHCAAAITILFPSEHVEKLTAYKVKFVVDEGHVHDLADTMAQDWASVHG